MKLILIYGPPAVGKLTVAQSVAEHTGFTLFHNHLSVDLVESVFDREHPSYKTLLWETRLSVFKQAAIAGVEGMLFTMVYTRDRESHIRQTIEVVRRYGGDVHLVHLYCRQETLLERVSNPERRQFRKILTPSLLEKVMADWAPQQPFATASMEESLSIDTDIDKPDTAALKIIKHFTL